MFSSFRNHSPQLVWKRKGPTEISSLAPNISPFAETFRNDRTSISNARLKDQKYHVEKLNRKLGLCPCFVGSIVRQTRLGKRNVCWIDAFSTVFKTKTPHNEDLCKLFSSFESIESTDDSIAISNPLFRLARVSQ